MVDWLVLCLADPLDVTFLATPPAHNILHVTGVTFVACFVTTKNMCRNWFFVIKLDWHDIFWIQDTGLSKVTGYQAKILVEPGTTPKYWKSRSALYF